MPAKSKSQQRLFAMALAQKRGKMKGVSKKVKELSKEMPEKELEKFAKTKHKGLKENHVLSFDQFVNEAYVDSEGGLQDFEFSPEDRYEGDAYEDLISIKNFLEDLGAKNVRYMIREGMVTYNFEYFSEEYMIRFDLDDSTALVVKAIHGRDRITPEPIYNDDAESLMDLMSAKGLDFLLGI